ncbi:hypothetical protein RCL1_001566 [Eukaryota sp. TZLM3-RCL]
MIVSSITMTFSTLKTLAFNNNIDELRNIFTESPDLLSLTDSNSFSLLHISSHEGHIQVTELLLELGVDPNILTKDHLTPLHLACSSGQLTTVELLLKSGSDPTLQDAKLFLPLHFACSNNHPPIVSLLLSSPEWCHVINNYTSSKWAPLHYAVRYNYPEVCRILLEKGADVDTRKADLWASLHLAAANNLPSILSLLLSYEALIEARTDDGSTALHLACYFDSISCVRLLIQAGADPGVLNFNKKSPFSLAFDLKHFHLISPLCSFLTFGQVKELSRGIIGGLVKTEVESFSRFLFLILKSNDLAFSKFEANISALKENLIDLESELSSSRRFIKEISSENENLKSKLQEKFCELTQKDRELEILKRKIRDLECENSRLSRDNSELITSSNQNSNHIFEMEKKLSENEKLISFQSKVINFYGLSDYSFPTNQSNLITSKELISFTNQLSKFELTQSNTPLIAQLQANFDILDRVNQRFPSINLDCNDLSYLEDAFIAINDKISSKVKIPNLISEISQFVNTVDSEKRLSKSPSLREIIERGTKDEGLNEERQVRKGEENGCVSEFINEKELKQSKLAIIYNICGLLRFQMNTLSTENSKFCDEILAWGRRVLNFPPVDTSSIVSDHVISQKLRSKILKVKQSQAIKKVSDSRSTLVSDLYRQINDTIDCLNSSSDSLKHELIVSQKFSRPVLTQFSNFWIKFSSLKTQLTFLSPSSCYNFCPFLFSDLLIKSMISSRHGLIDFDGFSTDTCVACRYLFSASQAQNFKNFIEKFQAIKFDCAIPIKYSFIDRSSVGYVIREYYPTDLTNLDSIKSLSFSEILAQFFKILKYLTTLHSVGLVHNNVSLSSIYLSESNQFLIGEPDLSSSVNQFDWKRDVISFVETLYTVLFKADTPINHSRVTLPSNFDRQSISPVLIDSILNFISFSLTCPPSFSSSLLVLHPCFHGLKAPYLWPSTPISVNFDLNDVTSQEILFNILAQLFTKELITPFTTNQNLIDFFNQIIQKSIELEIFIVFSDVYLIPNVNSKTNVLRLLGRLIICMNFLNFHSKYSIHPMIFCILSGISPQSNDLKSINFDWYCDFSALSAFPNLNLFNNISKEKFIQSKLIDDNRAQIESLVLGISEALALSYGTPLDVIFSTISFTISPALFASKAVPLTVKDEVLVTKIQEIINNCLSNLQILIFVFRIFGKFTADCEWFVVGGDELSVDFVDHVMSIPPNLSLETLVSWLES